MGKIYKSRLNDQRDLENRMNNITATMSTAGSSSPKGSYAQGILGGAATGASIGTAINAGWGTAIGAVVGAGAGAIGTAAANSKAEDDAAEETDLKENMKLQNKLLKQKWQQNQSEINWFTGLRNRFRYR